VIENPVVLSAVFSYACLALVWEWWVALVVGLLTMPLDVAVVPILLSGILAYFCRQLCEMNPPADPA
jgi:hypothetical protein